MEYTELADYQIYAGSVAFWRATSTTPSTDAADERPLSPQHEKHVKQSSNPSEPSWIGTVFEINQAFDADAVRRTLLAWHAKHESFRTMVAHDDTGLHRVTYRPESLELTARDAGTHDSVERVYDVISRFFDHTVRSDTWPHLVAATVVPTNQDEGSRFLLAFAADHSVMDAYSQLIAVSELDRLYAAALAGEPLATEPAPSYVDFSVAERARAAVADHGHETTRRWEHFLAPREPRFPAFPLPNDPFTDLALPQRSISRWLVPADVSDGIHAHARELGHGMQSAVLVALTAAMHRATGTADPLKFVMPMHTRTPEYTTSMGWFVGISPFELGLADTSDVREQLRRADVASAHIRSDAQIPFASIADLLGIDSAPRFVVSFVDVRHLPGAAQFDAARARALRSIRYSDDEFYFWVVRARDGINVSVRHPNNPTATRGVERYLREFTAVLRELAEQPVQLTA
ncbi:MAG TPA: condensation domain-containing protein [Flexivirga sp.]|uniref:condensation domain-containing protein n=1 Tax=Flexivirga sp. TaxID=1962927 RepID=UPI002CAC3E4D|nr:condensation domain-containing protein [Flexivirga sp.]HWC22130.1 condensation domain-containing protein [Flexivirga sp.]